MKRKLLLIIPFIFPLVGCSAVVDGLGLSKTAYFMYQTTMVTPEGPAQFTFDGGLFTSGFDNISYVKTPLIAGDCIEIDYTGEIVVAESYPSQYSLKGNLFSSKWHLTTIEEWNKEIYLEGGFTSYYDYINRRGSMIMNSNWVILDEDMNCCRIEEYDGDTLYVTQDMKYVEKHRCPPNANCNVQPFVIGGFYAYRPASR